MVPVRSMLTKVLAGIIEKVDILTSAGTEYEYIGSEKHPGHNCHPNNNPVVDSKSSRKPSNKHLEQSEK